MKTTVDPMSTVDKIRVAVITMSDKGAQGLREDTSGASLTELMENEGFELCHYSIVPDNVSRIISAVTSAIKTDRADLILTTGGTGVSPTDVTPEAMDSIFEKEVPGIPEAMRAASQAITPRSVLSRGRAGIHGRTLIINLPGSKKAAMENILVVLPALAHAVEKIKGSTEDCARL